MKFMLSALPQICWPDPFRVKVPFEKLALPATPTEPTSWSNHVVRSGGEVSATLMLVVLLELAEVPVMVTTNVPVAAVPLEVTVNVLDVVVLAGLKEAVTPEGRPEADKATEPVKPGCGTIVTAVAALLP